MIENNTITIDVGELYNRRNRLYKEFADVEINLVRDRMQNARNILEAIK